MNLFIILTFIFIHRTLQSKWKILKEFRQFKKTNDPEKLFSLILMLQMRIKKCSSPVKGDFKEELQKSAMLLSNVELVERNIFNRYPKYLNMSTLSFKSLFNPEPQFKGENNRKILLKQYTSLWNSDNNCDKILQFQNGATKTNVNELIITISKEYIFDIWRRHQVFKAGIYSLYIFLF